MRGRAADLVVLPELVSTGYVFADRVELAGLSEPIPGGPTTRGLEALSRETGHAYVAGIAERASDGENERLYNSAVVVTPSGYQGTYRKLHLFDRENDLFDPGDGETPVFDIGGARVGVMICFDWFYPETMRLLALAGADVVAHPSNLVMPYCQRSMPVRCLENHVFALTANRTGTETRAGQALSFTGESQITGFRGDVLARAPSDGEAWIESEIDAARARDRSLGRIRDILAHRRTDAYRALGFLLLALGIGGCAAIEERRAPESPYPSGVSSRTLARYQGLDPVILDDESRRWVISPRSILELSNGFLSFEFGGDEGITGPILSVDQDRSRLWIGTTRGVQTLDKDLHSLRTFIEEANLQAVYVAAAGADFGVALTGRGVALIDAVGLAIEIHPLVDFSVHDVNDALLVGDDLWVGTDRGLRRFSIRWREWRDTFGGKEIRRATVVRIELAIDRFNGVETGRTLYAVTPATIFIYRPQFDQWERVGL